MEFLEVIKTRKSIRDFSSKSIPEEILQEILEAGRIAPSFQNRQCWHFIVITEPKLRKQLALHNGLIGKVNFFIKDAPVIIVACANPSQSGTLNQQNYYLVDVAIAFQQMMLTAWNFGIGSCWLAAFSEKKVKKILALPANFRIVAISPFGYPNKKEHLYSKAVKTIARSKRRKDIEKIVSYNYYKG